ncbi:MAG: type II toxin-antitoxin system HicA family toxin [SAR202 cluster bacterium]|nr:type II toxin-antitoxin system HicA family toxin [SAR202 cluster bacterium]
MNRWPSTRARQVLAALLRIGWTIKRQSSSHRTLAREGWPDFVFAFHDNEEICPRMLARIAKYTGLQIRDLLLALDRLCLKDEPNFPVDSKSHIPSRGASL